MIYKYYVYQNDEMFRSKLVSSLRNDDVLYHYKNLETDLKVRSGEPCEVIITDSSARIGVLVNIDSNKSRNEVGLLLGESIQCLNSQNPDFCLSAKFVEG